MARGKVSLSELSSDGDSLYWLESRPAEGGRVVLVRAGPEGRRDHSPATVSIRSRVHEYGGGAVCLVPGRSPGAFAYVDQTDQRVWLCDGATGPVPLSATAGVGEEHRHGGLSASDDGAWVLSVRETHREGGPRPTRAVVALSTHGAREGEVTLLEGHGFYGAPRADAALARLAVVVWDHPNMPWDASRLLVVPLSRQDGGLVTSGAAWVVAGGPDESVGQPRWARDGTLRFVSDRRGWWQPYAHPGHPATPAGHAEALSDVAAEFHGPDWVLGLTTMAELADGATVARMTATGSDAVVVLGAGGGTPWALDLPCVSVTSVCAHGEGCAVIGSTPATPTDVWAWTPVVGARALRGSAVGGPARRDVAVGEPFTFAGRSGRRVHGTLYRPTPQRNVTSGRPPLVVWCHSGPTSAWQAGLDLSVQFFTTRGFAVAGVDYAGSTGYGRDYRCSLWGLWGLADAEDCLDAALHLVGRGEVDASRLAVRGSSAGGMTALNALASGEGFSACVSWYGVTDLLALAATTHDFESQSNERLVGPLPDTLGRYQARSPVQRAADMHGAVLLLHGTADPVVPPAQAQRLRDALDAVGTRCDLRLFEGEGHGFRRAETLEACLETELAFYLEVLGL